jgi:hypothetical protein
MLAIFVPRRGKVVVVAAAEEAVAAVHMRATLPRRAKARCAKVIA